MSLTRALSQSLLDNLTINIIVLNHQLQVNYINPSAEVMLATSHQRCLNLPINEIITEQSQDITLEEALKKGHPCTKLDAHLILHDNQSIMADYVITPIQADSQTYYLIEISTLEALKISRDKVTHTQLEGNKMLLRGLAHEIKNPLGGIRGAAQLLERELTDNTFKEYTRIFIEEADRISNLVDQMLGTNKLPQLEITNIHEILERVYQLISAESQGRIKLIKDYDPSIPELRIDAQQMIQALLNISRNALQAVTESNVDVPCIRFKTRIIRQLTIGTTRHKMVLSIEIIDNGPGIPDAIKDTLFYPLVSGRSEGTGLGLSITQNIITQHKGVIECHSQPGETTFSLFLPFKE